MSAYQFGTARSRRATALEESMQRGEEPNHGWPRFRLEANERCHATALERSSQARGGARRRSGLDSRCALVIPGERVLCVGTLRLCAASRKGTNHFRARSRTASVYFVE